MRFEADAGKSQHQRSQTQARKEELFWCKMNQKVETAKMAACAGAVPELSESQTVQIGRFDH